MTSNVGFTVKECGQV